MLSMFVSKDRPELAAEAGHSPVKERVQRRKGSRKQNGSGKRE